MDTKKLGAFIADLRKEKGITQAQLADLLHLTPKAVSKWERGLGYPDITTLEPLAEALGISISELFQCQKIERSTLTLNETDRLLKTLAAYQEEVHRYQLFRGVLCFLLGVALLAFSLFGYITYLYSELQPGSPLAAVWAQISKAHLPILMQVGAVVGVFFIRLGIIILR